MTPPPIHPVPFSYQRTAYSSEQTLEKLRTDDYSVTFYTDYVLWDSSTEYMVNNGMPTDADVKEWIKVLEAREDVYRPRIEAALHMCRDYIKA